ncbi:MAG: pyridoxamine 5'-phosphate oxidase family protein [Halieaceae bacterium]|nr:pyridoxamine 5'-phosphate oxidase family protein [Halieaceae bacterium]
MPADPAYLWSDALRRAIRRNRRDAHNRYLQLATIRADGAPALRTLVFRGLSDDGGELYMVTDQRSAKAGEVAARPASEACWYFSHTREQFRLRGELRLDAADADDPALRLSLWEGLSEAARAQFYGPHPGRPLGAEAPAMDAGGDDPPPPFAALTLAIVAVDHLVLRGEPQRRWLSRLDEAGCWTSEAVNP